MNGKLKIFLKICLFFLFSEQINAEVTLVFEDVTDEFSDLASILKHFEDWRHRDMSSYKDTYFSLCLPKVRPILEIF